MSLPKQTIIGLGTGRCGTVSASRWLKLTHEASEHPHPNWKQPERDEKVNRLLRGWGDVSLFNIYILDELLKTDAIILVIMRDRDETIHSILNHKRARGTLKKYLGDRFDFDSEEGVGEYWDWYYDTCLKHERDIIVISPEQIPIKENKGPR